ARRGRPCGLVSREQPKHATASASLVARLDARDDAASRVEPDGPAAPEPVSGRVVPRHASSLEGVIERSPGSDAHDSIVDRRATSGTRGRDTEQELAVRLLEEPGARAPPESRSTLT